MDKNYRIEGLKEVRKVYIKGFMGDLRRYEGFILRGLRGPKLEGGTRAETGRSGYDSCS